MRQIQVSDIVRRFADVVESDKHQDVLNQADPLRFKLTAMLDALDKYAQRCDTQLRIDVHNRLTGPVLLSHADGLRRFADMLDKKHSTVRQLDVGYKRLTAVLKAMNWYAKHIGVDLGLGTAGLIVPNKLENGHA